MKHKSNKTSTQNITVSNLLNRLESLNCCTYAETKEYYETFRARDLPQKVKFWKGRKFGSITVSEQYFINWKLLPKSMSLFTKSMLKGALSGLRQVLATESPLKMIKNTFYFISKALFVLKIFKVLSWIFGHVVKRLD